MLDVPLYKAYLFPNGVYIGEVLSVEVSENSFWKKDPENSTRFQLKIEFKVKHTDKSFPGRNFKITAFVSLALSGKSKLLKYYEALTGEKTTLQQLESAAKVTPDGLVVQLDEQKMLGRKVQLVIEEATSQTGVKVSKVTSILPKTAKLDLEHTEE